MTTPFVRQPVNQRLFPALCAMEMSLLLVGLSGYRANYKPTLISFLESPPGWVFLAAIVGGCVSIVWLIRELHRTTGTSRGYTIALNVLAVLGAMCMGEMVPRSLAVGDLGGEHIGSLLLRPRGWHAVVRRYDKMADEFESSQTFFVGDPVLGWSVGENRRSQDKLLYSNAEGIRSSSDGESYLQDASMCRVAIVGDSFALAEGVPFEMTWGAYLESQLGRRCQVLNFGVSGYGIGQMYLRLKRDVLTFRPDVLIVAFTDGAVTRTMGVYGFLMMTDWECPWAQPRFAFNGAELSVVNAPLPRPREIFSSASIRDLPYISYDRWYLPSEWEQRYWAAAYTSYAFRWATSVYPLHNVSRPEVSDEALEVVNTALFRSIQSLADSNGITPIVMYLPKRDDFKLRRQGPLTHRIMRKAGMNLVDATPCVERVPKEDRFVMTNYHYSPQGNKAVADCVLPHVQEALIRGPVVLRGRNNAGHG